MAAINDLIGQIQDKELRERIQREVDKMSKQKKFGLVFEEHLPECTPLYDVPVKVGATVAKRTGKVNDIYKVLSITDGVASCLHREDTEVISVTVDELVCVAEFGEPIYPYLKPLDSVCNAPDSDLWHTLIEADNYHALQLLEYLYAGKVDCIYIDPPYNTGAKDWKYNNDYVDSSDTYRHSKWLSMMQKRLKLAKKLLNPKDSVLIVTIDEKEYLHLGCLLEEMFPEARIQMVSSVINPAGAGKQEFARTDEYIYFIQFGASCVRPESREEIDTPIVWDTLRRSSLANARGKHGKGACGPNQFYPIYVNDITGKIEQIGDPLPESIDRSHAPRIPGCTAVFPIRPDGTEMNWGIKPEEARLRLQSGYLRAGMAKPNEPQKFVISYVTGGIINDIASGVAILDGYNDDGSVIAHYPTGKDKLPTTNWNKPTHDAQRFGTNILTKIIGGRFQYPKSIYAVKDAISYFIKDNTNALVVDFFAGSGTTLHAVNLLNAEDNGRRRCILVTNNEVSAAEEKILIGEGYKKGDPEWEKLGIAHYVTWPRTVCSIMGTNVDGSPLEGDYGVMEECYLLDEEDTVISKHTGKTTSKKIYEKKKIQLFPLLAEINKADGFKANAAFFKLGFLDKNAVALGRQFKEMLPTLWMKAGAIGKCPVIESEIPSILFLPDNHFAVLTEESAFENLEVMLSEHPEVQTVFIVTDYEAGYCTMAKSLKVERTYQLYRDYLDNFRINTGRDKK